MKKESAPRPPTPGFVEFVDEWNALQGQATPALHARMAGWLAGHAAEKTTRLVLMAFRAGGNG